MTTEFAITYHKYIDDRKTSFTKFVTFKWYERINQRTILKKFFKQYQNELDCVYLSDVDHIELVIDYINR